MKYSFFPRLFKYKNHSELMARKKLGSGLNLARRSQHAWLVRQALLFGDRSFSLLLATGTHKLWKLGTLVPEVIFPHKNFCVMGHLWARSKAAAVAEVSPAGIELRQLRSPWEFLTTLLLWVPCCGAFSTWTCLVETSNSFGVTPRRSNPFSPVNLGRALRPSGTHGDPFKTQNGDVW